MNWTKRLKECPRLPWFPVTTLFTAPKSVVHMGVCVCVLTWRNCVQALLSLSQGAPRPSKLPSACTHPAILSNAVTTDVLAWYHLPLPPDSHRGCQFLISQQHSFLLRSLTRQFYSSLPHNIPALILFPHNTMNRSLRQRLGGNELVQFPGPMSSPPQLRRLAEMCLASFLSEPCCFPKGRNYSILTHIA